MTENVYNNALTSKKVIASIFLSILAMSIGQTVVMGLQEIFSKLGLSMVIGNIISGGAYIAVSYSLIYILCTRFLGVKMQEFRMGKIKITGKWLISAIVLPSFVTLSFLALKGQWHQTVFDKHEMMALLTFQIFVSGIGGGIIEEITFRGVIMSALDSKWGKKVAILVPSIIFALGHVAAKPLNDISFWLLLISGISIGIMFSLVVYESGSIWCSAIIHVIWNACISGGLLNISTTVTDDAIFTYVIMPNSPIITGGDYGIETSIFAIVGYLVVALIAWINIRKNK